MFDRFPESYHTVDAHNHVWLAEGGLNRPRALSLLEGAEALGIETICVSVPLKPDAVEPAMFRAANDAVIEAMRLSSRFKGFCFVDAAFPGEAVAEIDRCIVGQGMCGIKLYHQHKAQDPIQAPVMRRAAELGVPILLHAGLFRDPEAMNREPRTSHAGDFLAAMKRYPDTIFMQGHIGGGGDWQWNLRMLEGMDSDNYFIDLSGSVVDADIIRQTVDAVGASRVLFATDGWLEEAVGKLQAARLSEKEMIMISSGNFARLEARKKGAAAHV